MERTDTATRSSNKEKAGDFLDRIDRIFKIRGFLGFRLSWFSAFFCSEVFGTRKQNDKSLNHAIPVYKNSVNFVNSVKSF